MVNKMVTSVGKFVARKAGSKTAEKTFDSYEKLNRAAYGIKPLNVGEKETIRCLQNPHNSLNYCKSVGAKAGNTYRKTGKYK